MKQGWEVKKLNEISENLDSKRVPITKNIRSAGNVPYYGASGIVDYVAEYLFDEDLLCVSEDGANLLARTYPIAFSITGKTWVNNHAHVLKFENLITQKFVELYLNSIRLDDFVSGMAQPKLNQTMLNKIPIPFPPLPEQQRIVMILDEAFEAINQAKANAEQNLKNAKELFESFLQSVFETKGEDWEEKKFDEVCKIFAGGDISKDNMSKYQTEAFNIPIFTNGEKNKGLYGYTNIARVTEPSITISARGTIGYSEIRQEPFYPAIRLIVITPDINILNLSFLKYQISNIDFTHSGTSIPQLTVPMIRAYKLLLPSLPEQQTIVAKLDALSEQTKKLECIYEQKLADLEELKKIHLAQSI